MSRLNLCRLCLLVHPQCLPLFENQGAHMLESLTAIKITQNDRVSTSICSECFQDLKTAFDIQQRISKVEIKHHEEQLADFLIENHDELVQLIQDEVNEIQIEEASPESTPTKHTCRICYDKFQFSPIFLKHLEQHVVESTVKSDVLCEHCGDVFNNSQEYNAHRKIHANEHKCETCMQGFFTSNDLKEHVKQEHTCIKRFICDVCNEGFSLRYILQLHKNQHSVVNPFVCEACGRQFKYVVSLRVHQKIRHKDIELPQENEEAVKGARKQLFQ